MGLFHFGEIFIVNLPLVARFVHTVPYVIFRLANRLLNRGLKFVILICYTIRQPFSGRLAFLFDVKLPTIAELIQFKTKVLHRAVE